tara:strand:- start:4393 stop:5184 length:792 start_codon:yes stop_codon:yes gene_type:complete
MNRSNIVLFAALICLHSPGLAGDAKSPIEPTPIIDDGLYSDFRFDGWIPQIYVGFTNSALGIDQNVFIGYDDIISNLDWAVPLGFDFRLDRIGFLPDILALKMSGGSATPQGTLFSQLDYSLKMGVFNMPAYYRVVDQENLTVDVLGGVRFLTIDLDVGLTGGPLGTALGPVSAGTNARILDGIGGIRIQQNISDKLFYSLYGDVGAGDSKLTWQVMGDLGYRVRDDFSVSLGYRYLTYSESTVASAVDLTASGPQITLNWEF